MTAVNELQNLINYYHENKLSHAYLIETNNMEKCFADLLEVVKEINCSNEYSKECNKCNLCNLIENNYLPSLIVIEADGKNIKKEQVLDLKSRFCSLPTFTKENIYILKEAEKLNNFSANTMLKFIEEPEDHIIGFFLTNNINNVINTIRSRCEIISVKYDNVTESMYDNHYFETTRNYIEKIELEKSNTIMYNRNVILCNYNEKSDVENILNLMLEIYRMSIREKDISNDLTFSNYFPYLIKQHYSELINKENIITKYIDDLYYNVNLELFLDKFVIELSGNNE